MDDAANPKPPPSTVPVPLNVTVGGLVDDAKASEFAHRLGGYLHALGTVIDISRLDALTVTDRYVEALAEVVRGFPASAPAMRSENEDMTGVAMCV